MRLKKSAAGEEIIPGAQVELTKAADALNKHGNMARGRSLLPHQTGNVLAKNARGQAVLKSMVEDLALHLEKAHHNENVGYIVDFRTSIQYGFRCSHTSHTLVGFLDPTW